MRLISYCGFEDVLPLIATRKTSLLPAFPKTVIVCLFPYFVGEYPTRNMSRYAIINDYHKVCGDILSSLTAQLKAAFPSEEFMPFIDNSPIREVRAAEAAALGAVGRHGMLIHEIYGSRVFIGTVVTSLELAPIPRAKKNCFTCNKCVDACPTGAISTDKPLNRALCRSAITQKKSTLTDWEQKQIRAGGFVWGCDVCADVCPMNKSIEKTPIKAFYEDITPVLIKENLANIIGKKPYNWRGEKVLLRNISLLEEA